MCLLCKHTVSSNRLEPAGLTPTPPIPFHTISMDFKGPLADSSYAFVILDVWSKWPEVYWTQSTSFDAIKKHLDTFISAHGRPRYCRSDSGPPFQSQAFADYMQKHGIIHTRILPENPQANEVESFMRNLKKAIETAKLKKENYRQYVSRMLMVIRATLSQTTGVSPHYAVTGRHLDPGMLDTDFP